MTTVREPAVAGTFYPDDPAALARAVDDCLARAQPDGEAPRAIIAPHAGYIYSGPVAGSAYARIAPLRGAVRRVVLLGPAHRVAFQGLALPAAEIFRTPLGEIPVDAEAIARIVSLPQVAVLDEAHDGEHSLEVHLPFLQRVLGAFALVPLVVGDARPEEVAEVIDVLWDGPDSLVVVSTDLSHYHDYETARRMDAETSAAIEALDESRIGWDQACGRAPVGGLLALARRRGLGVRTVDLRNSGDTAGPRDRVVGYGAYVVG